MPACTAFARPIDFISISTPNLTAIQREYSISSYAGQQDESEHTCSIPTSGTSGTGCAQQSSRNSQSQQPVSKKMKLVLKHTPQHNQTEADSHRIRSDITNYLQYVPGDDDDDRWSFGEEDCFLVYSILPRTLSRSASSVPVESMFSTMGLLLNGKRSTLAPHRANWLTFIHDNYTMYFIDTDL